jgi:hypothetical protein
MKTRIGIYTCVLGLGICLQTTSLLYGDEIPACRLGAEWREALGFGGAQASAMGVNSEMLQTIEGAVESYCSQNRGTVEPLLATIRTARENRFRAYELGTATSENDQTLIDAIAELATTCSATVTSIRNNLSAGQKTLFDRIAANRLLDPELAIINLSSEQRSALKSAQRTRDLTLMHHKNRKDLGACRSAMETFGTSVTSTLTANQPAEYETNQTSSSNNFGANLAVEEQACN